MVSKMSEDSWRAQVSEAAAELEALYFRLLGVRASLPPVREPDLFSTLRAGIECVLTDRLDPAIRALRELVAEQDEAPPGGVH